MTRSDPLSASVRFVSRYSRSNLWCREAQLNGKSKMESPQRLQRSRGALLYQLEDGLTDVSRENVHMG